MEVEALDKSIFALTLLAALGSGLIAGVFFAFSTFVMKALARLPPSEGIAAMQAINVTVLNPWFLGVFFSTAVACVVALFVALTHWREPGAVYLLVGGAFYLIGTFLVTIVFNVPKNQALASNAPSGPDAANVWTGYLVSWTNWNHVRTAAAFVAAALFSIALVH